MTTIFINPPRNKNQYAELHFNIRWGNTHAVLRYNNKTLLKISVGQLKEIKSRNRKRPYAGQHFATIMGIKCVDLGFTKIVLYLKNFGKARQGIAKGLRSVSKLQIIEICDVTRPSYNGCRPPKMRRL